jgi:hypothetical protein
VRDWLSWAPGSAYRNCKKIPPPPLEDLAFVLVLVPVLVLVLVLVTSLVLILGAHRNRRQRVRPVRISSRVGSLLLRGPYNSPHSRRGLDVLTYRS